MHSAPAQSRVDAATRLLPRHLLVRRARCACACRPLALATATVPSTYGGLIRQARVALRRYREQQGTTDTLATGPTYLQLTIPLPVNPGKGTPLEEWPITSYQESDWPGGAAQKFRALRLLVDALLEGYDPTFLGMLEDPADGVGCWSLAGTTLLGSVTNATFSSLVKLCDGGYGSRPCEPGHTIIAVNPEWTTSQDIGQPWSWRLKQRAAELVDAGPWPSLYSCQVLRTSRGRYGVLLGEFDCGWSVHSAAADDASTTQRCILQRQQPPITRLEAVKALAAAEG